MVNKGGATAMVEDRLSALEARVEELERTVRPRPAYAPPPRVPAYSAPRVAPTRPTLDLEELLGGRVLAWLGGVAVLAGLAFLLTVAISRGWLGEEARTVLAAVASLALLGAGVVLHERRGRTDASMAAAAAGLAGCFATLVVAAHVYHLIPTFLGLALALLSGAAGTGLALRWRAQGIGWLGLLGALASPAALTSFTTAPSLAFLLIAYAATVGVLLWQRWTWLAFAAFALATPQWLWTLLDRDQAPLTLVTLAIVGVLGVIAAVGFELRSRSRGVRPAAIALLVMNALAIDAAGWALLSHSSAWLVAVAAIHAALGLGGLHRPRLVSHELSLVALGLGIVLGDVAFAALTSGLPLVLGWAAGAVGFAGLLRRAAGERADELFASAGLGGHLLVALAQALVLNARLGTDAEAIMALAAVAAGAGVSARAAAGHHQAWRVGLDGLALAALAYLSALALDGLPLTAALAAEALVLTAIARREHDRVAAIGAAAYASLAALHASLFVAAPVTALFDGLDHPAAAAAALAAGTVALLGASRAPDLPAGALIAGAALSALYLVSAELVTPFSPAQGQTLLSVLWALVGVTALVAGLVADRAVLRRAGLGLLAVTAGKVFLYDLAALDSLYRVGSLTGLGLLLLAGAYAWQRVRPRNAARLVVKG